MPGLTGKWGTPEPQLVILGGDIGAYSLARAFFEATGRRSTVISQAAGGVVLDSQLFSHIVEPNIESPATFINRLSTVAHGLRSEYGDDTRPLLLGSADWLVRFIVENAAVLSDWYTIPYVDLQTMDLVTDKVRFGELCQAYDVAHPVTKVYPLKDELPTSASDFRFPVILKAADTSAYHNVEFTGKQKVYLAQSEDEFIAILTLVKDAGFTGDFLAQEFIPGNDSGMRILTCYSDKDGKVRAEVYGRVLLEEHTPGALGNPAAIIVEPAPAEVIESATRLLDGIGWRGYANFDLKVNPATGVAAFFELNPRLGRSNYYLTASGFNPVEVYLQEYAAQRQPSELEFSTPQSHLYTILPYPLLRRYLSKEDRDIVKRLRKDGRVSNPLWSRHDRNRRRVTYVSAHQVNQVRKFRRWYPVSRHQELAAPIQASSGG